MKKFLGIVAMLVAAVAVKFGIAYMFNSPVHAEAGDCVRVTGSENNPDVDTKDCGDKDANYKVVKVVQDTFDVSACTVGEAALAQEWDAERFVLCLDPVKK
ncbi:LppU/SCO3897 family protein [Streptomyces bauhiniae]